MTNAANTESPAEFLAKLIALTELTEAEEAHAKAAEALANELEDLAMYTEDGPRHMAATCRANVDAARVALHNARTALIAAQNAAA